MNNDKYKKIGPGTLMWCSTKKAREGKYGNKYEASIVVDEKYAHTFNQQFHDSLSQFRSEKVAEFGDKFIEAFKIKWPFFEELDKDGNKTGKWVARATAREFIEYDDIKQPNQPKVVDSEKKVIDTEVGNGSEGYIVVQCRPWALTIDAKTISMPLWLDVVQVTNLVPFTGDSDPLDVL